MQNHKKKNPNFPAKINQTYLSKRNTKKPTTHRQKRSIRLLKNRNQNTLNTRPPKQSAKDPNNINTDKQKYREMNKEKNTLGSSSFFCRSWFKTSRHSENFRDWKSSAASLAREAATERPASSSGEAPSLVAADDSDVSRESIDRSRNQRLRKHQKCMYFIY